MLHYIQQLQDGQNVFEKEEKMSMIILHLLVHYPNLQEKILNWFDKLSANDLHSTYNEIIADTSLSHDTIERIIHDCLRMKKVTFRWVLHQLTHEQRVKLCCENLAKFQNGSWRLYDIVTSDETWIYHRQIDHK